MHALSWQGTVTNCPHFGGALFTQVVLRTGFTVVYKFMQHKFKDFQDTPIVGSGSVHVMFISLTCKVGYKSNMDILLTAVRE